MIDIAAWRAIIGLFRPFNKCISTTTSSLDDLQPTETKLSFIYTAWPVLLFISYVAFLLMLSGDVELNPGPIFKNCPICYEKVHIKQIYCTCGYALRKSKRGKVPPTRATNVVSSEYPADANMLFETTEVLSTQSTVHLVRSVDVNSNTVNTCVTECPLLPTSKGNITLKSTAHSFANDNCNFSSACETECPLIPSEMVCSTVMSSKDNVTLESARNSVDVLFDCSLNASESESPLKSTVMSSQDTVDSTGHSVAIMLDGTISNGSSESDLESFNDAQSSRQLNEQSVSSKWNEYKDQINYNRRCKYRNDPCQKLNKHQYYARNSTRLLARYHSNPTAIRKQALYRYYSNHDEMKNDAQKRYHSDATIKRRAQNRYHSNPSAIKKRALDRYHSNPSAIKKRSLDRYHSNSAALKKKSLDRYYSNPRKFSQSSLRRYYANHENAKAKKREEYKANRLKYSEKHRITKLVALSISKKYNRMRDSSPTKLSVYVSRLVKKMSASTFAAKHLAAEHLVRTSLHYRESYKKEFVHKFCHLRTMALAALSKASEATSEDRRRDALCGISCHTATTESYFPESTYEHGAFDAEGNVVYSKFPSYNGDSGHEAPKTWVCLPDLCKVGPLEQVNLTITNIYEKIGECTPLDGRLYVQNMNTCTMMAVHDPKLLGHAKECHLDTHACQSALLYLRRLAPHYPNIRKIVNVVYSVLKADKNLTVIGRALQLGDLAKLEEITKGIKDSRHSIKVSCEIVDESQILLKFNRAFTAYQQRCLEFAEYPCISCTKLCFKRECVQLDRCIKPITGEAWERLQEHLNENPPPDDGLPDGYICKYCLDKFREGTLPPRCMLNGFDFDVVPSEIMTLNQYEKVLTQRAKVFQFVTKMLPVSSKRLPASHRLSKVRGSAFHLPLPLEETLKRLPLPTEPLPSHAELFILVRSIPTARNVVWQDMVDVHKVYEALSKLKDTNPLYSQIELPSSASALNIDQRIMEVEKTVTHDTDTPMHKDIEPKKDQISVRDPMVRRIETEEEEQLYENYTIQPLHAPRENEKATFLYQFLRVDEPTLDNRCKELDIMCFPDLFPRGFGGLHQAREIALGAADYVKTLLLSRIPRFRLNLQFLFYHFHQATLRQLSSGIFHKLKILRPHEKLTAGQYLEKIKNQELEGELTSIFGRLRNSESFWLKPRNDLNCMTMHYGPATWFLTISPSEWMWPELGEYLRKVNPPEMAHLSISELIAADPVSTSRFIENKLKAILEFLTSDDCPIGKVTHYFVRMEYQGRGIEHFHIPIWIEDSPIIGVNSEAEVTAFITKYVTCQIPDASLSPILHDRVLKHQMHRCNSYCMRSKKTKSGIRKVCRFGFPRPETETFRLRSVVESIAGRKALKTNSRLYDLPRKSGETRVNDYNPAILLAWEGNMDLQYIGERSAVLNWYCTKYATKAERSHANSALTEITSTKSVASQLWNIALKSLSNRECGALEASDTLLSMPLYFTDPSTVIRWVDVNMVRNRRVKEHRVISELPVDSEELFYPSWVDNYYPNRPHELEEINLHDFLAWHDMVKKRPSDSATYYEMFGRYLKKRQKPYLINHFRYNPELEPEKYFYAILLLFKPWRDCGTLLGDCSTYADAFNSCKDTLLEGLKYHDQLTRLREADSKVRELVRERKAEIEAEELENTDPPVGGPLHFAATEVHNAMVEFEDAIHHEEVNVDEMILKLNEDQLRVFNKVKSTIDKQNSDATGTSSEILRLFISGCGGTGKSYLIKTIKAWVQSTTGKDVAVSAPTGISAFGINGLTIHRLLMLPVEHGKTAEYRSLSDGALKIVRDKLRNVTLLIIDEISMVSNVTLLYIHLRLTEIFQTQDVKDGWFGQRNLLFLGDLLQLPPVFEGPVFKPLSLDCAQKHIGCVGTVDLWRDLFEYEELCINMRQKGDQDFVSLLSRIRLGHVTNEDINILEGRKLLLDSDSVSGRMKQVVKALSNLPNDTVCLLPTRHMCEQLNHEMLKCLPGEEIRLLAEDSVDCPQYLRQKVTKKLSNFNDDSTLTAGLEKEISIKIGCKIMLRRNIDVSLGLVNGAIGTVCAVKYSIDQLNVIDNIIVKFNDGNEHHLEKVNSKFQILDKAFVIRRQFPITSAYAITIHKSQGLSLRNVITDIGNSVFTCGQSYVAMSRVTSLSGLHLINLDPRSIKALDCAITEYTYLRETFRPGLPSLPSHKKRPKVVSDRQWCISKSALTVQQRSTSGLSDCLALLPNKGFTNSDGLSTYVNSAMQCILGCKILRAALVRQSKTCLKGMAMQYETSDKAPLDCTGLRAEIGFPFNTSSELSPSDFVAAVSLYDNELYSLISHGIVEEKMCNVCGDYVFEESEVMIRYIDIVDPPKSVKLNEIISNDQDWKVHQTNFCTKCKVPNRIRSRIVDAQQVLIVNLTVVDSKTKTRARCNFNAVPSSTIKVGDRLFKLKCSIHYNHSKNAGVSYCSVISDGGKWIHCTDQVIRVAPWPKGAKDLYMLFYESAVPVINTSTRANQKKSNSECHQETHASLPVLTSGTNQVCCKRFFNIDRVSCYANAVMQCLLQSPVLRRALQNSSIDPINRLANDYAEASCLLVTPVRHALGPPFCLPLQQDVCDFFQKLADVCTDIDENVSLQTRCDFCCSSCDYNYSRRLQNRMLVLFVPSNVVDMSELLNAAGQWNSPIDFKCSSCRVGQMRTREILISAGDVIVVALSIFNYSTDGTVHKKLVLVNQVDTSVISINGAIYRVHSTIYHHGVSPHSGHYTSIHRNGDGWCLSDDMTVRSVSWPEGSVGLYMLFYHRVEDTE